MTLQDRGTFRKNSLFQSSPSSPGGAPVTSPPSDQRIWNQSQGTTNKALDYLCLLNNLSEAVPGSNRKLSKKPSFRTFQSFENYENISVLASNSATPTADHDLKLLKKLKSGELENIQSIEKYRQSLVIEKKKKNSILQSAINFTRPKSQQQQQHEQQQGDEQNSLDQQQYPQRSHRSSTRSQYIKAGEIINSPLNPDRPGNHIAMMEKLRKLKYEQQDSFESFHDENWDGGGEEEEEADAAVAAANGDGDYGDADAERLHHENKIEVVPNFENYPNWEDSLEENNHHFDERQQEEEGSSSILLPPPAGYEEENDVTLPQLAPPQQTKSQHRYTIDSTTPSPFLDSNGNPLPAKKYSPSKQVKHFMTPLSHHHPPLTPSRPLSPSSSPKKNIELSSTFPIHNTKKKLSKKKIKLKNKKSQKNSISAADGVGHQPHPLPPSSFVQQKFQNQSAGLDIIDQLDMQSSFSQEILQSKISPPPIDTNPGTSMNIDNPPPSQLKTENISTKKHSSHQIKSPNSSPKYSKAYYEFCTLQVQPESQISWNRLKRKEAAAKLKKQKLLEEEIQQRKKRNEEKQKNILLMKDGIASSTSTSTIPIPVPCPDEEILVLGDSMNKSTADDDNDTISDFTIQEFIGLQVTYPSNSQQRLVDPSSSQHILLPSEIQEHTSSTIKPSLSLRIERDELFSTQDLDNLSQAPSQSIDSQSGLLSMEGLVNMKISVNDPLILVSSSSPQDVIAKCIGKLLFSSDTNKNVHIRPASAGIGGISRPKIYSTVLGSVRPMSGQTSTLTTYKGYTNKSSHREDALNGKLFSHETKRRNIIEKSLPADRWLT